MVSVYVHTKYGPIVLPITRANNLRLSEDDVGNCIQIIANFKQFKDFITLMVEIFAGTNFREFREFWVAREN